MCKSFVLEQASWPELAGIRTSCIGHRSKERSSGQAVQLGVTCLATLNAELLSQKPTPDRHSDMARRRTIPWLWKLAMVQELDSAAESGYVGG